MPDSHWQELTQLLLQQNDENVMDELLKLLLTAEERESITARLAIISSLLKGGESQRDMAARLGVSIATITRGSNNLKALDSSQKGFLERQLGIR
ncbi:MAG: trp operon repressor [Endozoicomonas sp.]